MTFLARGFFSLTFVYFAHSTKLVVFSSFVVAMYLYIFTIWLCLVFRKVSNWP